MREAQYPRFAEHKEEHAKFLVEVSKLVQAIEKKELNIHQKILDFLKSWYSSHILGMDRDYLEAFRVKGFR